MCTQNDFFKLFKTFKTIENSFKFLNSSEMSHEFSDIKKPLLVQFQIEENFRSIGSYNILNLTRIFIAKSIVVVFMSERNESFSVFWKLSNMDFVLTLKPVKKKPGLEIKELYKFVIEFLIFYLSKGHLGKYCI